MPKIKSHSGAKKRFKVTAKGKVMAKKAMGQHILTKKSRKNKRGKKNLYALNNTDAKLIKILIT